MTGIAGRLAGHQDVLGLHRACGEPERGETHPRPEGRLSSPGFCGGSFIWLWWSRVGVGQRHRGPRSRPRFRRGGRARARRGEMVQVFFRSSGWENLGYAKEI